MTTISVLKECIEALYTMASLEHDAEKEVNNLLLIEKLEYLIIELSKSYE
jgi:hypothetical protein